MILSFWKSLFDILVMDEATKFSPIEIHFAFYFVVKCLEFEVFDQKFCQWPSQFSFKNLKLFYVYRSLLLDNLEVQSIMEN